MKQIAVIADCHVHSRPASTKGIVIFEIGTGKIRYAIHRALLVYYSKYFHMALHDQWKEADEGVVELPDVETPECKCR